MPMTGLILVLHRSPEQQAAFDAFVASQYDPTSPNFHRWLHPEEVGEKFGPALADIATVSSWLASHGLSVDGSFEGSHDDPVQRQRRARWRQRSIPRSTI